MNIKKALVMVVMLCSLFVFSTGILAQQEAASAGTRMTINWWVVLETVIYAAIGIILSMIAYKVYDLLTPFSLNKELSEDQNLAVGILLGSIFIGIAIIIAASIA